MIASTLLLLQTVNNLTQAQQRKRNESTSSKVPMYSTSCCGDNTSQGAVYYCNIIPPSQENLYCRTLYIAPVETLIPSEVVSEDTSVYGTLDSVEAVK